MNPPKKNIRKYVLQPLKINGLVVTHWTHQRFKKSIIVTIGIIFILLFYLIDLYFILLYYYY